MRNEEMGDNCDLYRLETYWFGEHHWNLLRNPHLHSIEIHDLRRSRIPKLVGETGILIFAIDVQSNFEPVVDLSSEWMSGKDSGSIDSDVNGVFLRNEGGRRS